MFDVVVAADLDWGIGKTNGLPWPKLKGDLAHFKRVTSEAPEGQRNAIIMGRKTFDSAEVKRRPLPRRLNIVISRGPQELPDGVLAATSLDGALATADAAIATAIAPGGPTGQAPVSSPAIHTIFVVGGAQIFREAFSHGGLRYVYLTRVQGSFGCDVSIPNLDVLGFETTEWDGACAAEDNGVGYRIERLRRRLIA